MARWRRRRRRQGRRARGRQAAPRPVLAPLSGCLRRRAHSRERRQLAADRGWAQPARLGGRRGWWRRAHLGRDVLGRAPLVHVLRGLLVRVVRALLVLNVAGDQHGSARTDAHAYASRATKGEAWLSVVCADHAEQRASRSPGARRGAAQRGPRVESKEDVERLDKSALNDAIRCFRRSRTLLSAWLFFLPQLQIFPNATTGNPRAELCAPTVKKWTSNKQVL